MADLKRFRLGYFVEIDFDGVDPVDANHRAEWTAFKHSWPPQAPPVDDLHHDYPEGVKASGRVRTVKWLTEKEIPGHGR